MPPPANDTCAAATVVGALPYTDALDTTLATAAGDPVPSCVGSGVFKTVWYEWTCPATGTYWLSTLGSNYDTTITVFTGACGALTEVDCNDDRFGGQLTSLVELAAALGTVYRIMVGAFNNDGGALQFKLRLAAPPDATVLSLDSVTSRNIVLDWTVVDGVITWSLERCTGVGCAGFVQIKSIARTTLTYIDRDLTPGETYRYRVRAMNATFGDGAYSNSIEQATLPGVVGVIQYGGMVRMRAGLNCADVNLHPGLINILGLTYKKHCGVYSDQQASTDDCNSNQKHLFLKYRQSSSSNPLVSGSNSAATFPTLHNIPDRPALQENCRDDQLIEFRFRLGSEDSLTHTHAGDGYIEVRLDGVIVLTVTGLRLGFDGEAGGWNGIQIAPSGGLDDFSNLGGMELLQIRQIDSYEGDSDWLYNKTTFAGVTAAEMWYSNGVGGVAGGYWEREALGLISLSVTEPKLNGDEVTAGASFLLGAGGHQSMLRLWAGPPAAVSGPAPLPSDTIGNGPGDVPPGEEAPLPSPCPLPNPEPAGGPACTAAILGGGS